MKYKLILMKNVSINVLLKLTLINLTKSLISDCPPNNNTEFSKIANLTFLEIQSCLSFHASSYAMMICKCSSFFLLKI